MEKSLKMKTRKYPMVSVVTITYNGISLLKDCLKSVYAMDYPRDRFEVVVVDNDSSDGTVEFVRRKYPTAKIVQNKANLGYVGMNNAMPVCRGKYIYVINNDIMVNRECLKRLVETLEDDSSIGMSIHTLINHYNRKLVSGGTWISDRKSTRLNSSHSSISYAVFCLEKQKCRRGKRGASIGPYLPRPPVRNRGPR